MNTSLADHILHPIRFRVLRVLHGQTLTPRQIGKHLPDVSPASLYRHLRQLVQAGLVRVISERPVRGTVEKLYTAGQRPFINAAEASQMSTEAHARAFPHFAVGLVQDFERYLAQGTPDLERDGVGYRQVVLNLSDEELVRLAQALQNAVLPFVGLPPAPERRARAFSTILIPLDDPPTVSRETPSDRTPLPTDH